MSDHVPSVEEDAELTRRVVAGLDAILGERIHVVMIAAKDDSYWLDLSATASDPVVLEVWIRGGGIYVTDRELVDEESDDLDPEEDRATWAVKTLADLARFGAARIRSSRFVPRSWNRLFIFESTERRERALAAAGSRVVSTFPPFALVPTGDDLAEVRARLTRGETVFVDILDGEFPGARLNLFPLEREGEEQLIDIAVEAEYEERLGISDGVVLDVTQSAFDDILAGRKLLLLNRDEAQPIVRELWGATRPAWGDPGYQRGSVEC